jgi:hypothetical protein
MHPRSIRAARSLVRPGQNLVEGSVSKKCGILDASWIDYVKNSDNPDAASIRGDSRRDITMKCIALAFSALFLAGGVASAALGANTAGLTGMAGGSAVVLDVALPTSK